jgi:hypothetical protein
VQDGDFLDHAAKASVQNGAQPLAPPVEATGWVGAFVINQKKTEDATKAVTPT